MYLNERRVRLHALVYLPCLCDSKCSLACFVLPLFAFAQTEVSPLALAAKICHCLVALIAPAIYMKLIVRGEGQKELARGPTGQNKVRLKLVGVLRLPSPYRLGFSTGLRTQVGNMGGLVVWMHEQLSNTSTTHATSELETCSSSSSHSMVPESLLFTHAHAPIHTCFQKRSEQHRRNSF